MGHLKAFRYVRILGNLWDNLREILQSQVEFDSLMVSYSNYSILFVMEIPFHGRFTTKWTWVSDRRFSGRWRSRLSRRSRLSLNRTVKAHQAMLGGFIGLLVQWFQWSMMDHDGPWLFHDYSIWFVCGMTPLTMWNTVKHCETNFCFFLSVWFRICSAACQRPSPTSWFYFVFGIPL